ncbi:MAG: carboxypeptidase regulatory-like domain-containing protein [Bacteroidetes bacterium]|nr:carboxypeptidase regulatory-like domain-containing protein [Bacteroidota bacterium]
MQFRKIPFYIAFFVFIHSGFTQNTNDSKAPQGRGGMMKAMSIGRFSGKVKDAASNDAMEYASVQLWQTKMDTSTHQPKEVLVGGMLTDNQGEFSLENLPLMGNFTIKISALGYTPYEQKVKFDIDFKAMQNGETEAKLLKRRIKIWATLSFK